jgi:hypothetical protein
MTLEAIYGRGLRLAFDYFKVSPGGCIEKLAHGTHDAGWFTTGRAPEPEVWRISPLPDDLRSTLSAFNAKAASSRSSATDATARAWRLDAGTIEKNGDVAYPAGR